jgi:hypothetical protein
VSSSASRTDTRILCDSPCSTPLDDAIALGLSIFPVGPDKRTFQGMRWKRFQEERACPDQIAQWRAKKPPAWAVVTGAISRIVILDFDGINGALLLRMNRFSPHVQTPSGGFHLWVKHPGWNVKTLNSKADKRRLGALFSGLDIRADGGYALFCGRTSKGEYRWLRPMTPDPIDRIPERMRAVLGLLHPLRVNETPRVSPLPVCPANADELTEALIRKALDIGRTDGRNNGAFWLATQARDNGFSITDDYIVHEYRRLAGSHNKKGELEAFSEREAVSCWRSAFERPAREPWGSI